jgi:hypothetical protein
MKNKPLPQLAVIGALFLFFIPEMENKPLLNKPA